MTIYDPGEESGGVFSSGVEHETSLFTTDFTGKSTTGTNTIVVSATAKNNGANGILCTFDGATKDAYAYKTFSDQTDAYVRVYFKRTGEICGTSGDSVWFLSIQDSGNGTPNLLSVGIEQIASGGGVYSWIAIIRNPTAAVLYEGSTNECVVNTWYCVEVRFLQHASTGGFQFWVGGASKASRYNLNTSALAVDKICVGLSSFETNAKIPAAGQTVYMDDVMVNTSAIGAYVAPAALWVPNVICI